MLVGDGFVIASPTKTGTRSLVHLARSNPELGLRYVPEGHRMTVPAEFAGYTRHMIVRDPYARLVSIYGYLRRRPGEWGSALAAAVGFSAWVEWFLSIRRTFDPLSYDAKAPAIWLATQAECWHLLRGDRFWKLEEIGRFLVAVGIRAELPRINVSRQVEAPEGCSDLVWDEWCREDCATFGYGRA